MLRRLKQFIASRQLPFPVRVGGLWLRGYTLHHVKHGYEPETTDFIRSFLKPGQTFLDIGANRGYFSALALSFGAQVVAYEPDPYAYNLLQTNAEGATLINAAVSDRIGFGTLYRVAPGSGLNSIKPGLVIGTTQRVQVTTCPYPYDLCKIDVEGAELDVLRGLDHKGTVICEFRPRAFAPLGTTASEFLNSVRELGYTITTLGGAAHTDDELIALAGKHSINLLLTV